MIIKNYLQNIVYHIQSRFTSVQSKNNTYDNIRKNKKFTKLKYLDLQSIKTEATYDKISNIVWKVILNS